jgi:hypothetical protein
VFSDTFVFQLALKGPLISVMSSSSSEFDSQDESETNMAKYNPYAYSWWVLCKVGEKEAVDALQSEDPKRILGVASLELDGNDLTEVPLVVLNGVKITELCLNANRLSVLPDMSPLARKLETLWLHNNQLTLDSLVHAQLWSLKKLKNLTLSGNAGLPEELAVDTDGFDETQALLAKLKQ